jgi:hypothetical protein
MSLFVEVFSIEKGCPVIINLDSVVEIAPLREGGCNIFYADTAAVGGKTAMKVRESYELFKQFVMTTVTADDIATRIKNLPKVFEKEPVPRIIPELRLPELENDDEIDEPVMKRGPGRPRRTDYPEKSLGTTTSALGN